MNEAGKRWAVRLSIEPIFVGPASWGTISHVKVIQAQLGISVGPAKSYVDRCVFEGEVVDIPTATREDAQRLADALAAIGPLPKVVVEVVEIGP